MAIFELQILFERISDELSIEKKLKLIHYHNIGKNWKIAIEHKLNFDYV